MTRAVLLLSASLAMLSGAAYAQDLRDLQARNAAAHALEDARRDLLSSQIETPTPTNGRPRSRGCASWRPARGPSSTGADRSAGQPIEEAGRRDAALSASDRMERLTQDALAESNTRMRSIRPASPKN
jgi:hypothetical protein